MILRSIPIATAAILAGFGANASSEILTEREAADFVNRFCRTLVPIVADYDPNTPGIWPPDDPAVFEPLITPDLADLIEDALLRNSAFEAEINGKGALGDGVPWTSSPDAAGECTAGAISGTPERPEIEVHYRYADAPDSTWIDRLLLARFEQEWRLDDIEYGDDDGKARLRSILAQAIEQ